MEEPSLEEMMKHLSDSKKGYLQLTSIIYSLILGGFLFLCFLIEYYLFADDQNIFLKTSAMFSTTIYAIFVFYQLYKYNYGIKNQSPDYHLGIYKAYYQCAKCESLYGGIFGKGPLEQNIINESCIHDWQALYKSEFEEKNNTNVYQTNKKDKRKTNTSEESR